MAGRSTTRSAAPNPHRLSLVIAAHREAGPASRSFRCALLASALLAAIGTPVTRAAAQTDYYNTDRGRPVQIEDAYATERYAFELKLAPARVEWMDGEATWDIEPEIAYGLLPRTHVEVGVPIAFTTTDLGTRRSGMAGLELSLMHNLNVETRTVPALVFLIFSALFKLPRNPVTITTLVSPAAGCVAGAVCA